MNVAMLSIGLLGLLQFLLACNVSLNRRVHKVSVGQGEHDSPLHRACVAHSNASEFVPIMCILMLTLEWSGSARWIVWIFGMAVASRYLHALGMLNYSLKRPNVFRFLGAAGSYTSGLLMAGFLIYWVLAQQAH